MESTDGGPLLVLMALLLGCSGQPVDSRRAWLVDALVDDNRVWLGRDPELLATKYARMAADPYDYMRGTAGVFLRDLARPGTDRVAMSFGTDPGGMGVLLVGDPHPENLSSFLPGDGPGPVWPDSGLLRLEVADIDGAAYGPWTLDVRRATLGLTVMLDAAGCDRACRGPALQGWGRGYADEFAEPAYSPVLDATVGAVLGRLREEANEEGAQRVRLEQYTAAVADGRSFRLDSELVAGNGLLALDPEEQAQLERLLAGYEAFPDGEVRILDAARRYGVGISSLPAVRYVVAWDRGAEGTEDDELLEVREVVDPVLPVGLVEPVGWLYSDQAERIVQTSHALWSVPEVDVRVGGVVDGAMTFKVRTWSSWVQSLDHEDVAGGARPDELVSLADALGRHLASLHRRSPPVGGVDSAAVIALELRDREQDFAAEVAGVAESDFAGLRLDYGLFLEALAEYGPLLGAQ